MLACLAVVASLLACSPDPATLEPKTSVLLDPTLADGFAAFPWPSDARLTAAGAPDLTPFPNHGAGDLIDVYVASIHSLVRGAGTNPLIHLRFDGDLDPDRWPTPPATLERDCPVQLVNVDPDDIGFGERIALQLDWRAEAGTYTAARTFSAFPAAGFVLRPETTYALVILDSLGDADGAPLVVPEELSGWIAAAGDLGAVHAPLGDAALAVGIEPTAIAAATVFTTGSTTAELRTVRDWVADPANLDAPELLSFDLSPEYDLYGFMTVYEGSYETPIFQRGDPPYSTEGGGFEFVDGEPVLQRHESLLFSLTVPTGEPPDGGFPVVIALPGTAGTPYDHFYPNGATSQGQLLSARGVATLSFEPPLHGSRGEECGAQPDLHSYNFFNPESSRTVFRQEAVDASVAIRFLRETLAPDHPELTLDPDHLGFFGHSQGAHIGMMLAAVEPELDPVFVNGMGGTLGYTLLHRETPFDIEEILREAIGEDDGPLTLFHPAMGLAQLLAEVVDPVNFAPEWYQRAPTGEATSVLQSNGFLDHYTPFPTVNAIAVASGTQLVEPVEWTFAEMGWLERETIAPPFSGNILAADGTPVTAGLITRANLGHYVVQDDYYTAWTAAEFLSTGLFEELPTVRESE
jgi:hypothetical protein